MATLWLCVLALFIGNPTQGQKKDAALKIPNLDKKDTDIQILHQLLLEEKNSRRAMEQEMETMRNDFLQLKAGYSTQNQNIKELVAQNRKLRTRLDKLSSKSVDKSTLKQQKSLIQQFAANASDVVSKMRTLTQFVGFVQNGNTKMNLTMQEVLLKLDVLARNLTSVNMVIKAYIGPMLTSTMNLNNTLARLKTKQESIILKLDSKFKSTACVSVATRKSQIRARQMHNIMGMESINNTILLAIPISKLIRFRFQKRQPFTQTPSSC